MLNINKNIISLEESEALKNQGYLAIDPHVHSSHSYDVPDSYKTAPENVIAEQERQGLLKIITDHDTMTAHDYLKRADVIKGVEIKITPKKMREVNMASYLPMHTLHINVYGLNDYQFQDLENISFITADLDEFVDYLKSKNLKYQYNHPFWHERGEKMNWRVVPEIAKKYFDVIELNAGRPKMLNDLALYLANEYDKGITSGTDSHTGRPGRARVLAKGKDFDEMWDNIKNGESYVVRNDITALGVMEEAKHMIENIFDEKIFGRAPENKIYAPDTGIKLLDNIARKAHKTGYNDMISKLAYKGLLSFNKSFGEVLAGRLYVNRENKFGEKIAGNIISVVYDSKKAIPTPVIDYV
jgi:predicted metal-dependent phosphoesterase TrpH